MKKLSILLILVLVCACTVRKEEKVKDEDKFSIEYSIEDGHIFEYSKINDILDIFSDGTGIVYFANSDDEISIEFTSIVNDCFSKKKDIKINYYNPFNIKNNNTKYYRELLNHIGENTVEDENLNPSLEIPSLYFIKNGKIIDYVSSTGYGMDQLEKKNVKNKIKKEIDKKYKQYKSA